MNEFIHTFSLVSYLYLSEKRALENAFQDHFFYNSEEKKVVMKKYVSRGFRLQITFNSKKEKHYDKLHRDCKVELIITPAKLLYPNEPMQKLFEKADYIRAIKQLKSILQEIELYSGVNLWNKVRIKRVDLAKDIITPSDAYSKEVIRLAKKALFKTGYRIWAPTESDVERTSWEESNSILFRNHNQGVNSKIYNKLEDIKAQQLNTENITGLLRFELSLKRDYLKQHTKYAVNHLEFDELTALLCETLEQANPLMQNYLIEPLWSGDMLSKDLQRNRIRNYCQGKNERRKKMLAYVRKCNKDNADPVDCSDRILVHFEKINLSPIYTSDEFGYVPSFSDLLNEQRNERMDRLLRLHEQAV